MDWLSLSILSSNVALEARVLQWASLASARSLWAEVSLLLLLGVLLPGGQASTGLDSLGPLDGWPPFHLRQSFKEDTTSLANSSVHSGLHSGDPGSLQSLYTWWYRSLISSLLIWDPTAWMAKMSACGSRCRGHGGSLGRSCIPPPFFPNGLLGGTSPEELEGDATPLPPNADTHRGTFQHPYTASSREWTGPPCLPTPWW